MKPRLNALSSSQRRFPVPRPRRGLACERNVLRRERRVELARTEERSRSRGCLQTMPCQDEETRRVTLPNDDRTLTEGKCLETTYQPTVDARPAPADVCSARGERQYPYRAGSADRRGKVLADNAQCSARAIAATPDRVVACRDAVSSHFGKDSKKSTSSFAHVIPKRSEGSSAYHIRKIPHFVSG